jgi:hypothetical protein
VAADCCSLSLLPFRKYAALHTLMPPWPPRHAHSRRRDGALVLAATRGDGKEGEDVTHNALTGAISGLPLTLNLSAVPKATAPGATSGGGRGGGRGRGRGKGGRGGAEGVEKLPRELEVRGEVFMTKGDFAAVRPCWQGRGVQNCRFDCRHSIGPSWMGRLTLEWALLVALFAVALFMTIMSQLRALTAKASAWLVDATKHAPRARAHTHTHTHTHMQTHRYTRTRACVHTFTRTQAHTHAHPHTLTCTHRHAPCTLQSLHGPSPRPQLNAARAAAGERPFDCARSAAAGSMRLLDPSEAATRRLSFLGYQLLVPGAAGGGGKVRGAARLRGKTSPGRLVSRGSGELVLKGCVSLSWTGRSPRRADRRWRRRCSPGGDRPETPRPTVPHPRQLGIE